MSMPSSSRYTRPLPQRSRWRTPLVVLACLGLGLLAMGLGLTYADDLGDGRLSDEAATFFGIDFFVGLVAIVLVGPLHSRGRANLALLVPLVTTGLGLPAACVGLVRLGALRSRTVDVLTMGAVLAAAAANTALTSWSMNERSSPWEYLAGFVMSAVCATAFMAWGRSRTASRELMESLHAQAASAEREREALASEQAAKNARTAAEIAQARAKERNAIARDMHDSLSHHLSVIAMHAGALAYRDDLSPEQVRRTAQTIRDGAEEASAELRNVLVALRDTPTVALAPLGEASREPLPTADSLQRLVDAARKSGQNVAFTVDPAAQEKLRTMASPKVVALTRAASELLVNANKHAHGERVDLTLTDIRGSASLRCRNPLAKPTRDPVAVSEPRALGTGLGLVGVEERVRLVGGMLTVTRDNPFEVEVQIPWQ